MRRFKTGILVRNNRLKDMQANGIKVSWEVLSNEQYLQELRNKLAEETGELISAVSKDDIKEELADVLEVIEHIIQAHDFDQDEIMALKDEKQKKIGGFDKKIKIHYVDIEDDNLERIAYYTARPQKYPEILQKNIKKV